MNDKEYLDNLKAGEELISRGYEKIRCKQCNGLGSYFNGLSGELEYCECYFCDGKGYKWQAPITK